ncbi:hypothetical protein OVA11_06125 [Caulobacter sp. SL161]|uniref:hypothetical protein n=1 Tax=Caulobacter sp. SL161 TaxID=2995156 RepID=UPI00227707F0|nr:hypothetical protein [Caulobacter sp. SL161]MCY1646666.1 hypothetical protein [Caulobacter sp. SL161]
MSLLTDTQGTPERVWSSIHAVAALNGLAPRDELWALLSPKFIRGGIENDAGDGTAPRQAVGASVSLGLLELVEPNYRLVAALPANYLAFGDYVHDRLCSIGSDDPDFLIVEALAWMVMKVDQMGSLEWTGRGNDAVANMIEADIGNPVGGDLRYNRTKITAWRRWAQFLDVAVELPGNLGLYPCFTGRVRRELARSSLPRDVELPVGDVLAELARRMPYVDGGVLQPAIASRMGVKTDRMRVSMLLSMALRDLTEDDAIELRVRGDASGVVRLTADDRKELSVQSVVLNGGVL